jgi:hypothetical protein
MLNWRSLVAIHNGWYRGRTYFCGLKARCTAGMPTTQVDLNQEMSKWRSYYIANLVTPTLDIIHLGGTAPPISVLSAQRLAFRLQVEKRKMEES